MSIPFVKMHSNGNDFVIIDCTKNKMNFSTSKIQHIGNRNTGIGFDQLILLEESRNFDIYMKIYNQNGIQAEMCGNAARCVASLLFASKKTNSISIETVSNDLRAILNKNGEISVAMKLPEQHKKHFHLSKKVDINNIAFPNFNKQLVGGMLINMGNPHLVFVVPNLDEIEIEKYGEKIEKNNLFKKGINLEMVQIKSRSKILIKFWERGVGITKSCGSGIMAAFYSCFEKKLCNSSIEIVLPIGKVSARLNGDDISVKGKAVVSFLGQFSYE